jgi:hypothetical protein
MDTLEDVEAILQVRYDKSSLLLSFMLISII